MKIKEDLIAQEPKHREAMEEVWSDMSAKTFVAVDIPLF